MFGLCTKKACILVGIITSLLPLLYDIRVDAAPGPHGIMHIRQFIELQASIKTIKQLMLY